MIVPDMGMIADALFSTTQQRVLALLFGQPARSFYTNEVIRLAGIGSGAVQRELTRLSKSGLLTVTRLGNQKHYQANADSPIFEELCSLVQKTFGLADVLHAMLTPLAKQLSAAFVYGSVAKRTDTATSDIDLMIISDDLPYGELFLVLADAEARLGRAVNPTLFTKQEFAQRRAEQNVFVTRVLEQPKLWLFGDENVLTA